MSDEKDDFDSPADKVIWDMICEIAENAKFQSASDWDYKFINGLCGEPLHSYSDGRRKEVRRIHQNICLTF